MTNNTETKAVITNLEKSDKRRLTNAISDLFMLTESYASKVFTTSPDDAEATLVDIKNLTMLLEDAAALIAEVRPARISQPSPDQGQMKFDNHAY
jgi:hypothetical protein